MKKLIVAASLLAASFGASAQDSPVVTKDYKPVAGNVTAELGLFAAGFNANPVSLPQSNGYFTGVPTLKFRYFLADQLALRVGLNIDKHSTTDKFYENPATGSGVGYNRTNNSATTINVGLEKHFAGTTRLSTYAGADISFRFTGASQKWENSTNGTTFTDGAGRKTHGTNSNGDVSSFGTGARLIAGADYYFVEKVYIGGEFGWGFLATKNGKVKDEVTDAAGNKTTTTVKSSGGSFDLGLLVTAGFRLGYRF